MVGVLETAGLAVIVAGHTLVAAVAVRLLRVRLASRWAPVVVALGVVPLLLVGSTLVLSGWLGLGPDLGSPTAALFVLVAVPLALGLAVDYLWMPPPEAVELPAPEES
ncbi:MAG: hypothetical protein ABEJ92_04955 [Halobacteriales archaeon]